MGVRVSAGEFKGRKIPIKIDSFRATSSKVRESVFNILRERIKDSVFIDLYAGSGAVGFEAMSRGAAKVFFVESDGKRAGRIEELLRGCGCRARAVIVRDRAEDFIRKSGQLFDIVFLDPPYDSGDMEAIMPVLGGGGMLAPDAVVIAEHPSKKPLPDDAGVLRKKKEYKYGDTMLSLFVRAA